MGGNEQYYQFVMGKHSRYKQNNKMKMTEKQKVQREITRCFKKYIVKRQKGNCQVLFALTELDSLVEEIMDCC